jgi:predicted MFS family arabinose efflux permease
MNRVLNVLALVVFAAALSIRAVDPVIPPIADDLAVAPTTAALLSTAFALPYAFVQPILGILSDMFSKTRLIVASLLILVLAAFAGAMALNFPMLLASRVLAGIAAGGTFPIALAYVADFIPVQQRQVAVARVLGAAMAGNLLGASGSGVIGDFIGWRGVLFLTGALGAIALGFTVWVFRSIKEEKAGRFDPSSIVPNYRAIFGNPKAKYCFGTVFLEGMLVFGVFPYVALLLFERGEVRSSIAGLVIAGFGLGGLLYTLSVKHLLGRFGERGLMIDGGVFMGVGLMVVGLQLGWQAEFAMFLMMGFAFYMLHGAIQVHVTELAPMARGSAMALHSSFFFFGQAAGPVVYGFGFSHAGVTASLFLGGAIIIAAGLVCSQKLRLSYAGNSPA